MDSPNETGASATASSSVMMFEDSTANGIKEVKDTLDSQEVKGILDSLEAKTAKQLCELVEHYAIPDTDMKTDAARRERIRFHLTNRQTSTKSVAEVSVYPRHQTQDVTSLLCCSCFKMSGRTPNGLRMLVKNCIPLEERCSV